MSSNRSVVQMAVFQHHDWPSSSTSTLWGREMIHHFLPRVGDRVAILTTEEEMSGSVHEEVVDIYFDFDGTPNITMRAQIVDPDERGEDTLKRQVATRGFDNPRNTRSAWRTETDGDLEDALRNCGWLPYAEWPGRMKR